ncbi:hypothetical protein RHMOL_Rhmol09G0070500 [Rhododendron molle]|uniref:Uncharacterized protein n=1 Tax=Rhododendron molle TaxID=49168 RepID=A0ACC0MAQ5_RHOML|nr:hypothetical protein RHMOL_Rhmol09G0070500 [Rhododendron molle]
MQPLRSSLCCEDGDDGWADQFCYDLENLEEEDDIDLDNVNYDDSDRVSKLLETHRYLDIMQKVEDALEKKGPDMSNSSGIVLQDYLLIVDCTALTVDIENEISIVHNFIRDN